MDCRRQLDPPRAAASGAALIRLGAAFLVIAFALPQAWAQTPAPGEQLRQIQALSGAEQWRQVADLAAKISTPSAEVDYYYGMALARLGRWEEARHALLAGRRLRPRDERFSVELAGIAFKQKRYREAAAYLRRTLRLAPHDAYANDFLATVYFLEGNLPAALKYWNRIGKPQIAGVRADPQPRLSPLLLDRAYAFSPASVLRLPEFYATGARMKALEIFPLYQLDLRAQPGDRFDLVFRNSERNGWGGNKWAAAFLLLRGLPAQTVYPQFWNIRGSGMNFTSMFRWDGEKRRLGAEFSGPFAHNPERHFRLSTDLRDENWGLYPSFTGSAPRLGAFNLRREAVEASLTSLVGGRWSWSAGAEVSHRDFRNSALGTALTPQILPKGYQLKQITSFDVALLRVPESRLTVDAGISSELGRIWSTPAHSFAKLQPELRLHWLPQAKGDDYEMQELVRAGKTWGSLPFDELSVLGIDADNDLWMRAHIATRGGRKGSAPLGRNYFLSNWEQDKNLYSNGLFTLRLGPFLDTGKITDPLPGLGSHEWLWDTGLQAKVKVLGTTVVLSYGKDLRSGNNAWYVTLR